MTREQLDAIRARLDAVPSIPWNGSLLRLLDGDARALLAEVERLTAEVESKVAQNVALMGMNGRLQEEVERLTKLTEETEAQMHLRIRAGYDKTVADSWRAWAEKQRAAAFSRGAAAMREAAASSLACYFPTARTDGSTCGLCTRCEGNYAQHIRNLPDPEDKP